MIKKYEIIQKNNTVNEIVKENTSNFVLGIKKITNKGRVNNTYAVTTTAAKYIVRIDPNETTLDRFKKEAWCLKQMQKIGVFSPQVLKIGIKNGRPFMLTPYIDGTDGDEIQKQQKNKVWGTLGKYAHKIHSIKVAGFGEKLISNGNFDGSWNKFINYNISSLNDDDKLIEHGIITKSNQKYSEKYF